MSEQYFHFTLGPVQSFVAQARRTRDFWAGSFILSWLVTVAMKAVENQNGRILFPLPDKSFMRALEDGTATLKQGNVPNRFKARVPKGKDAFNPQAVEKAVRIAWKELAQVVLKNDFLENKVLVSKLKEEGLSITDTEVVWERQIKNFWDMQWAVIDSLTESNTLDRLKNWRTHLPPEEGGVKCMMMEGWQELSGVISPIGDEGKKLKAFWQALRDSKPDFALDLREGEHLCVIAFIKRRFVRYFEKFNTEIDSKWTIKGWKIPFNVPSVDYMAAAPWLADLMKKAQQDLALNQAMWHFHDKALALTKTYNETDNNINCIVQIKANKQWEALDGRVFFETMLANSYLWDNTQLKQAEETLSALKKLHTLAELEPVSPFYAILLMDGDDLGKQMSDGDKQDDITDGLSQFTSKVEKIVEEHSGFLIYAGGDDVLALFPLEYAMGAAVSIQAEYKKIFIDINTKRLVNPESRKRFPVNTSISAAIEYVHIKTPLGKVLKDAHDLLDNVAKDKTGRDSIACRVWKQSGLQLQWSMPWKQAIDDKNRDKLVLETIADKFREYQAKQIQLALDSDKITANKSSDPAFASKFFFTIRERFDLLNPPKDVTDTKKLIFDYSDALESTVINTGFSKAVKLMAMEYLNSGVAPENMKMPEAEAFIRPLLEQCLSVKRKVNNAQKPSYIVDPFKGLQADAALLVRFLAQKGIEKGRD